MNIKINYYTSLNHMHVGNKAAGFLSQQLLMLSPQLGARNEQSDCGTKLVITLCEQSADAVESQTESANSSRASYTALCHLLSKSEKRPTDF